MKTIRVGLLGLGQVGTGFYEILKSKKSFFKRETGVSIEIKKIAVKRKSKKRKVRVPKKILTSNALEVIRDPKIDVIIELIGGTGKARQYVKEALKNGKHVVTANKALLAVHGDEIFKLAVKNKVWINFEASVGGGIPIMKALREGLVANRVDSIYSIINGTSNYILSSMSEEQRDFKEALLEAQKKGFAEADPTFDIEGVDAAHKLAILSRFCFGGSVRFKDVHCEGISRIRSEDISFAEDFGFRIKLLAIAKSGTKGVEARVQPTLLPRTHILANVNGAFNAVLLRGDEVGEVLLYGQGAGPHPTASAIFSDLIDIAKRGSKRLADDDYLMRGLRKKIKLKNISSILSRYYLRFHIVDRPGVLAQISRILGKHSVSISDCVQKENCTGRIVPLILLTHPAHEKSVSNAIKQIDRMNIVRGKSQVIRIEES